MPLNTNYFPGDSEHNILAKLLLLFGGSPTAADGRPQLLRKLLAEANSASGGLEVPLNFQDSADDADAVVYHTGGTVENCRFTNEGWLRISCSGADAKRVYLSNTQSQIAILGSIDKSTGAFLEMYGQAVASGAGSAIITTKVQDDDTKGVFRVLNAAANSSASTTRYELFWNGDCRQVPVWNDNLTQFTAFKLDIQNTNSADDSKAFDVQVDSATVFSVNKHGNIVQKQAAVTYGASVEVSFTGPSTLTLSLTGDVEITTDDRATGRNVVVKILCDGSDRSFTWSENWTWIGTAEPASIAADKTAILSLTCFGPSEGDIVAVYSVEQ